MENLNELKTHFPIESIGNITKIVKHLITSQQIKSSLPYISLIIGWFEHKLIIDGKDHLLLDKEIFPILTWQTFIDTCDSYHGFIDTIPMKTVQKEGREPCEYTKNIIKLVSDHVWKQLKNTFSKDKQHVQTVYSFLYSKSFCFYYKLLKSFLYSTVGVKFVF